MIEFSEVRKTFGVRAGRRIEALRGVTFSIAEGESLAVIGPNGAGKSTLLALVLGFLRPTAGDLVVGGRVPRDWVRDNGAGWLPERFALPPEWSVAGSLRALARLEGMRSDAASRVPATLDRFGLGPYANRTVGSLSRGLLQRLGLAQAVLARRPLVILDEPTNGLDPGGRRLFRETVAELKSAGTTLLIASHDLAELERTTGRAIVIEDGRVRETIEVAPPESAGVWTIRVSAPEPVLRDAFPGAKSLDDAASADPAVTRWSVTVEDVADLNTRLARLLAGGGHVIEVTQAGLSLEERIRQSDPDAAGDK